MAQLPAEIQTNDSELDETVSMAHRFYRECQRLTDDWRIESRNHYDLVACRQWDTDDIQQLTDQQRPAITVDRIGRTVEAVKGTQVANRQDTQYLPRQLGASAIDELITGAGQWVRDECDAEDEESDAFEDMFITGMGWTETRLDYDTDPEGATLIERVDPLQMYWDVSATKRNLSDRQWQMRIKPFGLSDFEARWPDAPAALGGAPWDGKPEDDVSAREHVYPQDAYNKQQGQSGRREREVRVAQLQWAVKEPVYRVGKDAEPISKAAYDKLKKAQPEIAKLPTVRQTKTVWKQAFIAGGSILEDVTDCPYPDGPTFRVMTYKRDRNKNTWYGPVRAMKDPQKFGNKFFSQILDILNKGAKGGVMAEKGAVDDPRKFEDNWARPDGVVWVRDGAIQQRKIQPKPVVEFPPGLDKLMAFSLDSVHEVTGINLEMLGMTNRDQPGVVEGQRKQSTVTILGPLFDAFRRYRKEQGRVLLYFIDKYMSDGRLVKIAGPDGARYVPLVRNPDVSRYDIVVDEAPTSPNMKEKVFGILAQILPMLQKMGIPLPPELLDYSPLPSALVEKWKATIQQQSGGPNPQQVQAMQKQIQTLTQQNAQLQAKHGVAQMTAQADAQIKAQTAQADMQLEQQKSSFEMQLEQFKAQNQLEIQRLEMMLKLQMERETNAANIQIAAEKAGQQLDIQREQMLTQRSEAAATGGVNSGGA